MFRLDVRKTYKLYIGGAYPRTESGRTLEVMDSSGEKLANACRASRKDVREACAAARKAQSSWAGRSAMNRGQILYRMAEMLEGRASEFRDLLSRSGVANAEHEVALSIDRLVHHAGFADKIAPLLGTVNPVPGPYFNFSMPEPTGVLGVITPDDDPLLGLVSMVAPAIVSGNTCVALVSESKPLPGMLFAEVLSVSDLPGGVVNLLSGLASELAPVIAAHMDVGGLWLASQSEHISPLLADLERRSAENVKRVVHYDPDDLQAPAAQGLSWIERGLEIKTVWHTMGV